MNGSAGTSGSAGKNGRAGMNGSAGTNGSAARPVLALLAAAVCAAAIWALAHFAVGTASGQRLDQLTMSGAVAHEGQLAQAATLMVTTVSVPVVTVAMGMAALLVVLRRRARLLLPLGVLVVGANLSTQAIKHLVISREALGPGIDVTPNSFPSGHTTLAASAVIALVLASGRARGVVAIPGALWTAGAGIGTLVVGWHRPSDVVGAILVVAAWTFLVLAADGAHTRRRRARAARRPDLGRRRGRGRRRAGASGAGARPRIGAGDLTVAVLLGLAGAALLVVGALAFAGVQLPLTLADTAQQQRAFTGTAAVIAGGVSGWLALVLMLRTPH